MHESSGRKVRALFNLLMACVSPVHLQNLYIASYVHSIDGMGADGSTNLINELLEHVERPKYRVTADWKQVGDMIIWDNTCIMHRATGVLMKASTGET
jgi:alpha-ketoglutarate-dependent taurine dioxygenase